MNSSCSELRDLVERFASDRDALLRFYDVPGSSLQLSRLNDFYGAWQGALEEVPYDSLGAEGRIDWHLLKSHLRYLRALTEREQRYQALMASILPVYDILAALQQQRRQFESADAPKIAATLTSCTAQLEAVQESLATGKLTPESKSIALRAVKYLEHLRVVLEDWFTFYDGYDPLFSWWVRAPYSRLVAVMKRYGEFLRETVVGAHNGEEPIVGEPIGRDGLETDLEYEMIPYTADELIAIAEKEFSWCMKEWSKVAEDMGFGTDWRAALDKTMRDHMCPGEQPELIAWQAYEAIDYLLKRDLLTIPPLAMDIWRMSMMSPQAQKTNPFFLGGEQLRVSFPTDSMDNQDKVSSLRANNIHLARATVQHELIPGHHMQGFCMERYNRHRRLFRTPFWIEGWALWWEFRLWDLGFPQSPENRAGMLFWRTHRCARIVFSLRFHIGEWTPEQCIDYLVDQVGHDRHTATGEVRRSFNGNYPPLYQAAYMIGAIQMRALYEEMVVSGSMREKDFHDRVIMGNMMPIEMVRAYVNNTALSRDHRTSWKFAGSNP
jgi:hypothetical protein